MEYKNQKPGKKSPFSDSFRRMVVEEVLSGRIFIAAAAMNKRLICKLILARVTSRSEFNSVWIIPISSRYNSRPSPIKIKHVLIHPGLTQYNFYMVPITPKLTHGGS